MAHFSLQSDPDDNPHFRRDWGDGPTLIVLRSEKSDLAKPITKTEGANAAKPEVSA